MHAHIFLPGTAEARIGAAAKGLIETAALVYQTDDFGLAAFWGLSGQGEHMVDDDIFFHRRETYILPGVGKRLFRMVEPMEPMGRIRGAGGPLTFHASHRENNHAAAHLGSDFFHCSADADCE